MAKHSIGIIGMGWVGSSVAISILQRGICSDLLLNDVNMDIAEGEAMDLNHGSSFFSSARVRSTPIGEMKHCDAVVITAGRGGKPDESRLDLLKENIKIAKSISDELSGFKGLLIIVANPVDVLTFYYQKFTGLPKERVMGTGTMLDTSRLRDFIAGRINVDPKSVHAHVIGEHGDSEVVLWSRALVGGIELSSWKNWKQEYEQEIAEKVKTSAYEIIKRKGATNHAIGLVTATLLKWLLRGAKRLVNVSTVIDGTHGISGVALSLPTLVSEVGATEVLEMKMSDEEKNALLKSADVLKKAIESVAS